MMTDELKQELLALAHAHVEDHLTDTEKQRLEHLIQTDAEARRLVADYFHDHATLYWDEVEADVSNAEILDFPTAATKSRRSASGWILAMAALIAAVAIPLVIRSSGASSTSSPSVAIMAETHAARWESGDLPTAEGSLLSPGRLRLAEGLATVEFDSGARLTLEAPAELRILDEMLCELLSGTVVADVPPSAIGFKVETPTARVVDYGTRFAVNVDHQSGATLTQVMEGVVEVEVPESEKVVRLEEGQRTVTSEDHQGSIYPNPEEGSWTSVPEVKRSAEWRLITTGDGEGQDAYAVNVQNDHNSDTLLLAKSTDRPKGPNRKIWLGFDLASLDRERIVEAELVLHFHPTGWGFASGIGDSVFSLYGLTEEALDDWSEETLNWQNAPANVEKSTSLASESTQKLATLVVPQGIQRGEFTFASKELTRFLIEDGNDLSTLMIVRDTLETESGGLVHGIASHRHPTLPAPTLALRMD